MGESPCSSSSSSVGDSYIFLSNHCLPAPLVFKIQLSWLIIYSVTSLLIFLALIFTLRTTKRYVIPATVLTYALMTSLALVGHVAAFLFGLRGIPAMIIYGLPMGILVTGVTYLIWAWFRLVISTTLNNSKKLQKQVKIGFYLFNTFYHVIFWGIWLPAGAFGGDSDPLRKEIHNILVASGMLFQGSMACLVGIMIFHLGKRLSGIIQESVDLARTLKRDPSAIRGTVSKIRHYSRMQSALWIAGGSASIGLGLWGLSTLGSPSAMAYFYYVISFWIHPSMLFADLLLVYAAVNLSGGRGRIGSEGSRTNTSATETGNKHESTDAANKSRQEIELV